MSGSTANIFDAWSLYDRVLDADVMFHKAIFRNVAKIVQDHFGDRPFSVLDLGCGSARHIATALQGRKVTKYTGVDLSPTALEHARVNVAALKCPVELVTQDLAHAIPDVAQPADLMFSAFAVHHLTAESKATFFRDVARRLTAGKLFIYVDTVRNENEDRATYLKNYCGNLRKTWRMFSEAELNEIVRHITEKDFPEKASTLRAMAADAGITKFREAERFGWHRTFCLER